MNSLFTIRRAALGVALLCSGLAAASALVGRDGKATPAHVFVSYGDLDLSKPEAAQILYRRIATAARHVCNEPNGLDLTQTARYKQCYETAIADAVQKVDAQTLTALHRTKTQLSNQG